MKALNSYLDENIDFLVGNVSLFMEKSDKEIEDFVGGYMVANSLAVSPIEGTPMVIKQPVPSSLGIQGRLAKKSLRGIVDTKEDEPFGHQEVLLPSDQSPSPEELGRTFADRLRKAICTDKILHDLLYDVDASKTLKNTIVTILPQLLIAMGVTGAITGTIWIAIIAAAIALLLRLGYNMYCQVYWETNGDPFEKKE